MDELDPQVFENNKKMLRGVELKNMGEYDEALSLYDQALSFYVENGLDKHACEARHAIAIVYRRMDKLQAARDLLDEVLAYCEDTFNDLGRAKAIAELAYLDEYAENYKVAIAKNREALEIYTEFEEHRGILIVHYTLSNLYLLMDHPDKTLPWYHCLKSIQVANEQGFDSMLPSLMERLAQVRATIDPKVQSRIIKSVMDTDDIKEFIQDNMDLVR